MMLAVAAPLLAQYQAPSDRLVMTANGATTWSKGDTDVVQLEGPVTIELEQATLTARQAVVWISPNPHLKGGGQSLKVSLIGDAAVRQGTGVRSGERMFVTAEVAGRIQLRAEERAERDASNSALYRAAAAMREGSEAAAVQAAPAAPPVRPPVLPPEPVGPPRPASAPAGRATAVAAGPVLGRGTTTNPSTAPTTGPTTALGTAAVTPPAEPVNFQAPELQSVTTEDGTVAIILSGGVLITQQRANNDHLELRAQRVVLFTPYKSLREPLQGGGAQRGASVVTSAYLEGDVRIAFQSAKTPNNEQRLEANRAFYELTTDRALLTDAVIHTLEPKVNLPVILRAKVARQLAQGEFDADKVQVTTSAFAVPSYAIGANRIYVRQDPAAGDAPDRYLFDAEGVTFRTFGLPIFYIPSAGGSMTNSQTPLRAIGFEHSTPFGFGALSEWGLFETLGVVPPRDLDLSYRADYYTDRGPATGLNARYRGGFITETAKEPWNFEGSFESYFVYDHGFDDVGRSLPRTGGDDDYRLRGHALFEHQHYFPDNWQLQLRAGWASDPTFLEQWFPREFDQRLPHDVSAYLKHQKDTEAFTLLAQAQPNDLVTTSDLYQEQFEVEHLPEVGYRRIGDSFWDDRGTFFSDNTVSGLHFQRTRATLAEQGFFPPTVTPGIPSLGQTGVTDDTTWRGDFRQEFDFPINAGRFKIVPYVVGRYTYYSDSPTNGNQNRLFAGAGARITTAFWKTDDTVQSELFDLHRLRHVIEPELNLFTSAQTKDRSDVFIYDEQIDPINDVSAASIALRQRWQTYRGGPGRWRSVDFLTLNVEANFFANRPSRDQLNPYGFRGLFFPSLPENSVPRNSINADLTWRIGDNTALLADVSENLDDGTRLATASIGLVARRDERMSYYLGNRYIADLGSNITTAAIDYQISSRYSLLLAQSFDFGYGQNVASEIGITRRFDAFFVVAKAAHNETTDETVFGFNIYPNGLGYGLETNAFQSVLTTRR